MEGSGLGWLRVTLVRENIWDDEQQGGGGAGAGCGREDVFQSRTC